MKPVSRLAGIPARNTMSDAQLMHAVRRGAVRAFEVLVLTHWDGLLAYAESLTADPDAAKDAVQEIFMHVWQARSEWREQGSVRAYLYRAVRNRIIDRSRSRRVWQRWSARWRQELQTQPPTPAEILEQGELQTALAQAIHALPERRREVFVLAHLQNLTYQEIADVLDIAPQTVANHMSLALRDLRRTLRPLFPRVASEPRPSGGPAQADSAS